MAPSEGPDKAAASVRANKPAPTRNIHNTAEMGKNFAPATSKEMARLKEIEQQRMKYDKHYITAEEARGIDPAVVDANPDLAFRIQCSAPEWPENRASATQALGPLEGGTGERTELRQLTFDELAQGEVNKLP